MSSPIQMELRNRRLSGDAGEQDAPATGGSPEEASDVELDEVAFETEAVAMVVEQASEDGSGDEQLLGGLEEASSGGFFGDFEEIEEDEDVERFISQNNTPTVSTRQSPTANSVARTAAESSDDESGFESVPEDTAQLESSAALPTDTEAPDIARLKALQAGFRLKNTPALPDGLFFSADVYKRYSVLPAGTPATTVAATTAPPSPPQSPPRSTQKPSSLRTNKGEPRPDQTVPKEKDTVSAGERQKAADSGGVSAAAEEDVVDTLLGVMASPRNAVPPTTQPPPAGDAAGSVPNDLLVAMMAVEGAEAVAKPSTSGSPRELAARLPQGYTGPFSPMTTEENAAFLALAPRVRSGGLSAKESSDYQRLKAKVDAEQQKFRTQAREKALPLLRQCLPAAANKQACARLSQIGLEALAMYPQLYMPVRVRALRSSSSRYVPFVYRDTLFQRGSCFHIADSLRNEAPQLSIGDGSAQPAAPQCRVPVSQDEVVSRLAPDVGADVAISASGLIALLTLPQMYLHDVVVPFQIVERPVGEGDKEAMGEGGAGPRRTVVVDRPLQPTHAATPRSLGQLCYDEALRAQMVDRARPLELAGGSRAPQPASEEAAGDNANYTLWEFGGLQVLIRYGVHGFIQGSAAPAEAKATTTVTLAAKLETQLGNGAAEARLAAAGGDVHEEISERERLAWWLSSYLRGRPSEVWVPHVDPRDGQVGRVAKYACADLYSDAAPPSTRGVADLLADLLRLPAGQYMLVHRRRTWDATIYKALGRDIEVPQRTRDAVMNLEVELAPVEQMDPARVDVEADYVPVAWRGIPGLVPFTHAPADTEQYCAQATTWNKSSRGRRRAPPRRKKGKRSS